jgi:tripartite-type tricarboxylate transporter receptor subunit TctC
MVKKTGRIMIALMVSGWVIFSFSSAAIAADYPTKPIKLIACAAAGGGEDTEARGIAPYLEKVLGVSIMVENQPGAGGKIAFEKFQRTEPDGYSLLTYTFPKSIIIE